VVTSTPRRSGPLHCLLAGHLMTVSAPQDVGLGVFTGKKTP